MPTTASPGSELSVPGLTLARDARTGFPCVRVGTRYMALLPLTKFQVEQYVWSGQAARDCEELRALPGASLPTGPDLDAEQRRQLLLDQLNPEAIEYYCDRVGGGRYDFAVRRAGGHSRRPSLVSAFHRQPLGRESVDEAVLATNLSYSLPDSSFEPGDPVPQPWTPAERVLRWLNGDAPAERVLPLKKEYDDARSKFAMRTAAELMLTASKYLPGHSASAARLLRALSDRERFCNEKSLPFLAEGVWEVTCELGERSVFAGRETGPIRRPLAVGSSKFLPLLAAPEARGHFLLIERHPAIGFRPLLAPEAVTDVVAIDTPVLDLGLTVRAEESR